MDPRVGDCCSFVLMSVWLLCFYVWCPTCERRGCDRPGERRGAVARRGCSCLVYPTRAANTRPQYPPPGKGAVYTYDAIGSYERTGYSCQGSGKDLMQPVLDNQLKADSPLLLPPRVGVVWVGLVGGQGVVLGGWAFLWGAGWEAEAASLLLLPLRVGGLGWGWRDAWGAARASGAEHSAQGRRRAFPLLHTLIHTFPTPKPPNLLLKLAPPPELDHGAAARPGGGPGEGRLRQRGGEGHLHGGRPGRR